MKKKYKAVFLPTEDLIPYPDNAKIHTQEQVALLAGRIVKEGFNQPIVVDKDMVIIKGHGRRLAAIKLKLEEVPVVVLDDLSPAEVKAARVADNKIAEKAEYDLDKLQLALDDIMNDIDLDSLGFEVPPLEDLNMDGEPKTTEVTGAKELDEDDFDKFQHQCPKCSFEWDDKK